MEAGRLCLRLYLMSISHWNARWYVINHTDEMCPESFAFACGLDTNHLHQFLQICQFVGQGKKERFKRVAFEEFLKPIPNVEYGWTRPQGQGTLHCIRIGKFVQKNGYVFKPEEQLNGKLSFSPTKHLPQNCEHQTVFVNKAKKILHDHNHQARKPTRDERMDEQASEKQKTPGRTPTKEQDRTVDDKDPTLTNPFSYSTPLCTQEPNPDGTTRFAEEKHQQGIAPAKRRLAFAHLVWDTPTRRKIGAQPILEDLNEESFPVLRKLGVQLKDDQDVKAILRDIDKLANQVKSVNIREFTSANERSRMWLTIPRSTTLYNFRQNKKLWLGMLLDAILASPEQRTKAKAARDAKMAGDVDEEERKTLDRLLDEDIGTSQRDSARWLLVELGRMYPDEFEAAAKKLGKPIRSSVMSPEASFAMLNEANIGVRATRVIRKHLKASGAIAFLPSEKKIRQLGVGAVLPLIEQFCPEGAPPQSTIEYAYKPLDKVVEHHLRRIVRKGSTVNAVDIVVGADHGQGAFRMATKIVMRASKDEDKRVVEAFIGEIECKKDTSEIIENSFGVHINHALDRMMGYDQAGKEILAHGPTSDGFIRLIYNEVSDEVQSFEYLSKEIPYGAMRSSTTTVIPFRIFVSGDLAFYSSCLGKENASGSWCWICKIGKSLWESCPSSSRAEFLESDAAWTLQSLQGTATKAVAHGKRYLGVIRKPMLSRIGVDRFVPPLLHQMLGIGNAILKQMLGFIDELPYEQLPIEIVRNREDRVQAKATLEEIDEELSIWNEIYGSRLIELRKVRKDLNNEINQVRKTNKGIGRNDTTSGVVGMDRDERRSLILGLDMQKRRVSDEIEKLQRDKKRIQKEHEAAARELRTLIKETPERSLKNVVRPLREKIERYCLHPFRIDRAVYHGGDLTGNAVRQLMANAKEVGDKVIQCLQEENMNLEENPRGDKKAYNKEDFQRIVAEKICCYADCLTLFDAFFSQCRATKEEFNRSPAESLSNAKRCVDQAMILWRLLGMNVTPKAHSCEVHNCHFMETFDTGLGDFDEEFVERQHQSGMKNRIRTRASMRDPTKMYTHFSYYEQAQHSEDVLRIKVAVAQNSKRKFKQEDRKETKIECLKRQRIEERERVVDKYSTCDGSVRYASTNENNDVYYSRSDGTRGVHAVGDSTLSDPGAVRVAFPSIEDCNVAWELERREKEDTC